jgi:hypothetical protein
VPIDAAEFDAHKDLTTIIMQFLCRNQDKGYSAKEIAHATGILESDVNGAMLRLSFSDLAGTLAGRKKETRIEDVRIGGTTYYRCVSNSFQKE